MKVTAIKESWDYGCRNSLQIEVKTNNDTQHLNFSDGEPEDGTLGRDFNDCYEIPKFLKKAYLAGLNGETFEIEEIENSEE